MDISDALYFIVMSFVGLFKKIRMIALVSVAKPVKRIVVRNFKKAGIIVDGKGSHDIRVKNEKFYLRLVNDTSLGLGESYMESWWDCDRVDEFFSRILDAGLYKKIQTTADKLIHYIQFDVFNLQTSKRSWEVAEKHYNLGKFYLF